MYDLIEYCDIQSKTSRSLWQYYRDEQALEDTNNVINFPNDNNNSKNNNNNNNNNNSNKSISFKEKITEKTGNDGKNMLK